MFAIDFFLLLFSYPSVAYHHQTIVDTPSYLCAILLGSYAQEKLTSSYPLLNVWLLFNQFICAQSLLVCLTL